MALASQVKETPSISPHLPCSQTDLPSVTDYPYSHCYPVSSSNSANIQLLSVSSSQLQNKALPYAQNYSKNILPYAYHLPPFSSSLSPNTSARITSNAKNACCFVPSFFPYAPSIPPFKESFNQSQIFLPSVSSSAFSDSFLHPTSPALPQLNRGHLHYFSSSSSCANFASEPLPLSSISASLTARPIPPPSTSVSAMPQKNDNIGLCNAMNTCAQPVLDCDGGNNSSDTNDKSFASCYLSLCGSSSPLNSISPSAAQFHTLNLPQKIICKPKVLEQIVEVPRVIYEHKDTYIPQFCVREKIVEVPRQIIQEKIVRVPKIEYRENIKKVPKRETVHKIIEVPEIKIIEKLVEKVEKITREKIVEKIKHICEEEIVHIPKIICQDKVYERPKIEYKHVEVERIEEVPEIRIEYEYKDVSIPRRIIREIPIDKIVEVKKQKIVERHVKKPIPHYVELTKYIETPVVQERFIKVEKKIAREVEIMQPVDTFKEIIKPKFITKTVERRYPVHTEKIVYEPEEVEVPVERIVQKSVTVKRCVKQEVEIPYAVYQDALIQTAQGLMPFNEFAVKNNIQIICKDNRNNQNNINNSFDSANNNTNSSVSCLPFPSCTPSPQSNSCINSLSSRFSSNTEQHQNYSPTIISHQIEQLQIPQSYKSNSNFYDKKSSNENEITLKQVQCNQDKKNINSVEVKGETEEQKFNTKNVMENCSATNVLSNDEMKEEQVTNIYHNSCENYNRASELPKSKIILNENEYATCPAL